MWFQAYVRVAKGNLPISNDLKRKGRQNNMTNEQIIFNEAVELMKNGKIGKTGRQFEIEDENGNKTMLDEPETIHTFQAWKARGFSVKKGEKAVAQFYIWKCVSKQTQDSDGMTEEQKRMFMRKASFFSASQVQEMN